MKKIVIPLLAAVLFACAYYAIPSSALERAAEICEDQGGLESIMGIPNNGAYFVCNSGERHQIFPIHSEKQ